MAEAAAEPDHVPRRLLVFGLFRTLDSGAYSFAAASGVGLETIRLMGELPHGLLHGTALQETVIKILSYSSAPTGLTAFGLVLLGLRTGGGS